MATITIDVPQKKELEFLKFLSNLDYIKIRDRRKVTEKYKKELIQTLKEVDLMEQGKLEKSSIDDFLKELRDEKRNQN